MKMTYPYKTKGTTEQMGKAFTHFLRFTLTWLITLNSIHSFSQQSGSNSMHNPPVNVEVLLSNRGMTFQMLTDKKFQSVPRLGFFSVTNLVGEWGTYTVDDYMTQASITYDLVNRLRLNGGFHLSSATGIRPTAGLIYSFANPDWLLIFYPRIDISKDANVEGLALVEYKPTINEKWRFYSRLQGLYAHTMSIDKHSRSYVVARAGVTYKEFTFGVGTNIDYYGPMKHNENSFGGFLSVLLF
ncbi:hypothetical protein OCK74_22005 [Chitinophagaceae bacterium LB-8]|uniref:Uncharacterized protein n=1 Tax=Paraflavisolibacter caeni TaxID=2982496 RepID=A0A9X3B990_9BACT|nr:hypothetical protein [Paraflavisolibacter caeni]MCU7551810.1 hypothetical protein [Paraflavisolibacter caeni]